MTTFGRGREYPRTRPPLRRVAYSGRLGPGAKVGCGDERCQSCRGLSRCCRSVRFPNGVGNILPGRIPQSTRMTATSRRRNGSRGLGRSLAAAPWRESRNERLLMRFDGCVANRFSSFEVGLLLVNVDHAVSMSLTGNHSHFRQCSFDLSPFRGEREHSSQDLKLAVDAGQLSCPASCAPTGRSRQSSHC